jgi:alkanesulfonate monooxygenase SsuD/methylene tetrahydromethanopterin reductase-like flavin-dependent oxidoreductase (luciferase family)
MPRQLRFDIEISLDIPWKTLVERARYVEQLGFDGIWLSDQIMDYGETTSPWLEAWSCLAGLSLQTTRIRLGTLVTHFNLHHPIMIARYALMVDQISEGRLDLGIGAGTSMDFDFAGVGPWTPGQLVGRLGEGLGIVDSLLSGKTSGIQGIYFEVGEGIVLHPAHQKPRPPITVAALGPKTIQLAARYGDVWNTVPWHLEAALGTKFSLPKSLEILRKRVDQLEQACSDIGRDPETISRSLAAWPLYEPTCPLSSPSLCEDFIGEYTELGFNQFIFYFPPDEAYPDCPFDREVFEKIATETLPKLRSAD